jgi:hypothetical protein
LEIQEKETPPKVCLNRCQTIGIRSSAEHASIGAIVTPKVVGRIGSTSGKDGEVNANRGSVKKWIDRYGDPHDPKVDAVDWVELIPFSETRNYVQRIMENLQVYRARFGGGTRLQIEADLHRGASVE